MPQPESQHVIARDKYDAVLLDLDGVLTDTANLHAAAWKQMFDEYLQQRAAVRGEPFCPFEVATDYQLRHAGGKLAVVTSSQNCEAVLQAAKLDAFFEGRVDGNTIRVQHLAGKPAPDTSLIAAKRCGVEPPRAVVEEALAGVQVGRRGNFGLVIGVARTGNAEAPRQPGAHQVVSDLG
jgi:beta-phosphoglucomutase-like phosphatase (HAD superfamily)